MTIPQLLRKTYEGIERRGEIPAAFCVVSTILLEIYRFTHYNVK